MADNGARQTRMIVPGDAEWPSGLEVMGADQPDRLFIRGDASLAELTEHSDWDAAESKLALLV